MKVPPFLRRSPALLLGAWISSCSLAAQARPPATLARASAPALVDQLVLPAPDVARYLEEDRIAEELGGSPRRFAAPIEVLATPAGDGTWERLPSGERRWRLRVSAPGATDLNFGFEGFDVPPGAELRIVSELDGRSQGPYGSGDVRDDGQMWTAVVPGDRAVIELRVPAAAAFAPRLTLAQVSYGYRDFFSLRAVPKQGACNNDTVCPVGDPWADQIQAVAVYTLNGTFTCTGTMISDATCSLRPFFLTADHCGIGAGNAGTMVVYWNFESPNCGDLNNGPLDQNQNGATLLATWGPSDFTLVELDDDPLPEFDVFWAGWDRSDVIPPGSVGIHHPNTDEKAISFNVDPLAKTTSCIGGGGGDTHWEVDDWEDGTTEPGSSGSALFDPVGQRLIGTLSGGIASCAIIDYDCYGRFAAHWTGGGSAATRLSDWLDPTFLFPPTVDGCYASAQPRYAGHRLVESCAEGGAGDGNGVLEPGESAEVWLTVNASGDLTSVVASLRSTSPGVTVTSGPYSFGTMVGGETREAAVPFTFTLADTAPCFTEITLEIDLSWDGGGPSTRVLTEPVGVALLANVPLAVPNRSVVESDLVVAQSVTLTDVDVRVEMAHGRVGHVVLRLRAPDGREVLLLDTPAAPALGNGGCVDNDMNVTFDDAATLVPETHCAGTQPWYEGPALPVEPLSLFNGMDSAGTWTLVAEDVRGRPSGTLVDWELLTQPAVGDVCERCVAAPSCPGEVMAVDSLRVTKGAAPDEVVLRFGPPPSTCALGTSVFASPGARPAAGIGSFPTDPSFTDRTGEDLDAGANYAHQAPAGLVYYLVAETLPGGDVGPSGHYGR